MSIPRYDIDCTMEPSHDGNYVNYEDHLAAVQATYHGTKGGDDDGKRGVRA